MMKRCINAWLCLCLLLSAGAKAEGSPGNIFVFGDSLSDTGNLAGFIDLNLPLPFPGPQPIGTVGLCNPVDIFLLGRRCDDLFFQESRVSNGPVAVEILAERLGFGELRPSLYFLPPILRPFVGTNYAVAGAKAGGTNLGDLNSQVSGFLADHGSAPVDGLYLVMIGGNDVIEAVKAAIDLLNGVDLNSEDKPQAIIDEAVDSIGDNISLLIGQGAQNILVANSVSIGSAPSTRIRADEQGIRSALMISIATKLTIKFNKQLAQRIDQILAERTVDSVKIKEFNLFLYFEIVRLVGRLFGWNTVDACFDTDTYRDSAMAERKFHPDCAPEWQFDKPKFDDFVFFDDLHPTGQVHAAIGRALTRVARKLINE